MPRYQFDKAARAALIDQLVAAGFPSTTLVQMDATRCWVTCLPEEFDRAVAVVAAHDALAVDQSEAATVRVYRTDLAGLKAYLDTTTPTTAQTVSALKGLVRALARELREDRVAT